MARRELGQLHLAFDGSSLVWKNLHGTGDEDDVFPRMIQRYLVFRQSDWSTIPTPRSLLVGPYEPVYVRQRQVFQWILVQEPIFHVKICIDPIEPYWNNHLPHLRFETCFTCVICYFHPGWGRFTFWLNFAIFGYWQLPSVPEKIRQFLDAKLCLLYKMGVKKVMTKR